MVAAAIGISGALSAGSSLIGGLTASDAASQSAAAQRAQTQQLLDYQRGILQGAIPMAQDLQANAAGAIDRLFQAGQADLGAFGRAGDAALGLFYNEGANALTRYLPQTIDAIRAGADQGINYLTGAADSARGYLSPFVTTGQNVYDELTGEILGTRGVPGQAGSLGAMPNISDPSQLPGYDFTLRQGLNAVRNASSASGIGSSAALDNMQSGPLGKALAQYTTGLASSNYSQYLQNYWANQQNRYNILSNTAAIGQNAGSSLSQILANIAGNQGNIASTAGANIGTAYGNVGASLASLAKDMGISEADLYKTLASYGTNLTSNAFTAYNNALIEPMRILANIASGTSTNVGNTGIQGAANAASSNQTAGAYLGSGITGAGSGLGNSLLTYNLLQNNGTGGSTVDPGLAYLQNPSFNIGGTP